MAWFAAAAPYISAGIGAASTIAQSNTNEQIAEIQARQQEDQATAELASAAQEAKLERRRAEMLKSRAIALKGKSGSSGPDFDRAISDLDEQGEYNALAALYSGSTAADSLRYSAKTRRAYGQSAKRSGYADAGATILSTMNYA